MHLASYHQYVELSEQGRKREATTSLNAFIGSFSTIEEKRSWAFGELPKLARNGASRIRHELFTDVVFPPLLEGFKTSDPKSYYWLAQLIQNLMNSPQLWRQVENMSAIALLKVANDLSPNDQDIRDSLLSELLGHFFYLDHEWPAGILVSPVSERSLWDRLRVDVLLAKALDEEAIHSARLIEFSHRMDVYEERCSA